MARSTTSLARYRWAVVAAGLAGCGQDMGPTDPAAAVVATVEISPAADTLTALGGTRQLTALAKDAAGNPIAGTTFTWSSSASSIAAVDVATGLVTAVANGVAAITATVAGGSAHAHATVTVAQEVASVAVTPATASLSSIGATQAFVSVAKDANGNSVAGVKFAWSSSEQSVATVDSTGLATAKSSGVTTITATTLGIPGDAVLSVRQVEAKLGFTVQPSDAMAGVAITPAVAVAIQDSLGSTVTGAASAVTVAIGASATGGTLSGTTTVNAVNGVATFPDISLDRPGNGYTLVATADLLKDATSAPFDITIPFAAVSAGLLYTCGVSPSGAAYCWGGNGSGRLGDGTTSSRATPVAVGGGLTFVAVSAGGDHTCGVTGSGAAYCWGGNQVGELGIGTTSSIPTTTPVRVSGGLTFAAISAGSHYTCGVTPGGAAYCWGDNFYGQLGNGTKSSVPTTTPVAVSGGLTFAAISAGREHTCGVTVSGAAYCWGANNVGRLGDGTDSSRTTPVPVSGELTFTAVSVGLAHTCGVTPSGAAYCWGYNFYGQLGDGTDTVRRTPVVVSGGLTFAAVSAAGGPEAGHTCGVTSDGAAYCWGLNNFGQLGDGTDAVRKTPAAVSGGLRFDRVSAGNDHTCGVTPSAAAYCWGSNFYGQLGDGKGGLFLRSHVPVRVAQ